MSDRPRSISSGRPSCGPYEVSYADFRHQVGAPLATTIAGLELIRQYLTDPAVERADLAFLVERCLRAAQTLAGSLSVTGTADEHRAA